MSFCLKSRRRQNYCITFPWRSRYVAGLVSFLLLFSGVFIGMLRDMSFLSHRALVVSILISIVSVPKEIIYISRKNKSSNIKSLLIQFTHFNYTALSDTILSSGHWTGQGKNGCCVHVHLFFFLKQNIQALEIAFWYL